MRLLAAWLLAPCLAYPASAGDPGPEAAEAPAELRRQSLLAGARHHAARASHLRPVITGCLEECGNRDQSCATQCQVCVEMNGCETLASEGCGACRAEVREARRWINSVDKGVLDSGGQPMLRDGVNMQLRHARLASLDAKRRLRHARGSILRAQRQVEWAHDENTNEVGRLRESKTLLERKEEELAGWRDEQRRRVGELKAELESRREGLRRTQQHFLRAKERLYRVRRNLARFQSGQHGPRWQQLEHEAADAYKRRHKQVKEQKKAMKEIRLKLRMREEDAKWLDRGLRREIGEAQELVDKDVRQVQATRSLWQHSRKELEQAKEKYFEASSVSHQRDTTAEDLKHRLDDYATTTQFVMPNMTLPRV
mmetsp:Transcript_9668/g.27234  ORF Transcript_9668/g.27234 Transcript_9668/m.27234 type:complete len:369 (-) Transcript_9668:87-1193(-)